MFAVESPVLADDSTLSDFALPNSQTKVAALNSCRPQLGWGRNPCCISKCVCIDTSKFMKQTEANANNQPNTCIHWNLLILSSNQSQVWVIGAVECVGRVRLVMSTQRIHQRFALQSDVTRHTTPYHASNDSLPCRIQLCDGARLRWLRCTLSQAGSQHQQKWLDQRRTKPEPSDEAAGTRMNQAQAIT